MIVEIRLRVGYNIILFSTLPVRSINLIMCIFELRTTRPRKRVSLTHLCDGTMGVIDMTITRWKVFLKA